MLKKIADNTQADSYANVLRKKRMEYFLGKLSAIPKPIKILDVGGSIDFWEQMNIFIEDPEVEITLLNLKPQHIGTVKYSNFISIAGDARNMFQFKDKSFDIVFSNSVIEHVGSFEDQKKMADEIMRVGKRYFIQTPYRYFPIEPHFLFPFFQFLPFSIRGLMIRNFQLGFWHKKPDLEKARDEIASINLLSIKRLKKFFPYPVYIRRSF